MSFPNPITTDPERWWDGVHGRPETLAKVSRELAAALAGKSSDYVRVLVPRAASVSLRDECLRKRREGGARGVWHGCGHERPCRGAGVGADRAGAVGARVRDDGGAADRRRNARRWRRAMRTGPVPVAGGDGAAWIWAGGVQVFCGAVAGAGAGGADGAVSAAGAGREPWEAALGREARFPASIRRFWRAATRRGRRGRRRCCCSTGRAITTACIRTCMAELRFPLQVAFLLSRPGEDFEAGSSC